MRFKDLPIGAHFKFSPGVSTFSSTAKKVSDRCYVWGGKIGVRIKLPKNWETYRMRAGLLKTCVGNSSVTVTPTGRHSPVKKRHGRSRGPSVLGGYRKGRR